MNGSPTFQRVLQDPSLQRKMYSRTQNIEVLVQHVILNEQSEGRVNDLRRSEHMYWDQCLEPARTSRAGAG